MKSRNNRRCGWLGRSLLALVSAVAAGQMLGCEVDSFFDPSKTGRFEFSATSTPILERIDVIEQEEDYWSAATPVTPEDLIPSDLSYRMTSGDYVTVEIYELYTPGQWTTSTRRIDAGGNFRLPEIGDVRAAGLTAQEFQDKLDAVLREGFIREPQVNVVVEEGSAFRYTVYGAVRAPGVFTLRDSALTLLDALAISGDVAASTENIYVIRQVPLTEEVVPAWRRGAEPGAGAPETPKEPPVDIQELIEELDSGGGGGVIHPGALRQDDEPVIDIDQLEPVRISQEPPVDVDELAGRGKMPPGGEDSFIYVEERGEWVRVKGDTATAGEVGQERGMEAEPESILERIIKVPYQRLKNGDSSYNIVIRPSDRIYVEMPDQGVVYIDGEIARPGVYGLPPAGRLTLSRLVAAAGGAGPLAIPERVDLIRVVGENREACVRVNLAAIRNRTEPDFYLKPDDHVIIGTSWWATPIAIMRNGFRATYGFGFLLDRNFGNDVFGSPPISRVTYQ